MCSPSRSLGTIDSPFICEDACVFVFDESFDASNTPKTLGITATHLAPKMLIGEKGEKDVGYMLSSHNIRDSIQSDALSLQVDDDDSETSAWHAFECCADRHLGGCDRSGNMTDNDL